MKYLILFLACFTLIPCGNEAEPSTQELIDSADVDGLEQKRSGMVNQIEGLRNELGLVTTALNRLDTTKKRALVSVDTVKPSELKHRISLQSIVKTDQNNQKVCSWRGWQLAPQWSRITLIEHQGYALRVTQNIGLGDIWI